MNKIKSKIKILLTALCVLSAVSAHAATMSDDEFLLKLEKDSFAYFESLVNRDTGLMPDSSRLDSPCSIASQGFGITALCIGAENGWITKDAAYKLILTGLKTFKNALSEEHGFYYHFVNMKTGHRVWDCELSSIDTALFIAGALTAGEYFKGTEIEKLANELYERIDWAWMLNGKKVLSMGWKPDKGFLPYYWDSYNELMILYALAIGSPSHPIPAESWDTWARPTSKYGGKPFIYCGTGSLFVYQYSHAWIDFRGKRDKYTDYWENSVRATNANRDYCIDNMREFIGFDEDMWGVTACIGPYGYKGYGAGPGEPLCDGTIAPSAAAGSIPFAPKICIQTLRKMSHEYGDRLNSPFGLRNGFNIALDWWCDESLGIDTGITILMIENYRTGFVWKYFMQHPSIIKWLSACFTEVQKDNKETKDK
ncbi:MAG: glucoamylase family protein [Elusimicrobiota bacterium]